MTIWLRDDDDRPRQVEQLGAAYCMHDVELDDDCEDCQEESEAMNVDLERQDRPAISDQSRYNRMHTMRTRR